MRLFVVLDCISILAVGGAHSIAAYVCVQCFFVVTLASTDIDILVLDCSHGSGVVGGYGSYTQILPANVACILVLCSVSLSPVVAVSDVLVIVGAWLIACSLLADDVVVCVYVFCFVLNCFELYYIELNCIELNCIELCAIPI